MANPYALLVRCFPPGQFVVQSVVGREAISEPYRFEVEVLSAWGEEMVERVALGQRAALVIKGVGESPLGPMPRGIHGIISKVQALGPRDTHGVHQLRLELVPRLWLTKRRRGSRIFQNQRIDQVIDRVLGESNISSRWALQAPRLPRKYCTQYEETEFAFVSRLCAEAGIYYYFTQPPGLVEQLVGLATDAVADVAGPVGGAAAGLAIGAIADELFGGETVVFSDQPIVYPPIPVDPIASAAADLASAVGVPTSASVSVPGVSVTASVAIGVPSLHYRQNLGGNVTTNDKVTAFAPARKVRPNRAEFRDYDPRRPNAPLVSRMSSDDASPLGVEISANVSVDPTSGISASATDPAAALAGAAASLLNTHDLEVYDHHGDFLFPEWDEVAHEAARMLAQERRRAHYATGESTCPAMTPGHAFLLEDHPIAAANVPWVVTGVRHRGRGTPPSAGQPYVIYENTFEVVPHTVAYLPKRPKRRRSLSSLTATVVGPPGEEIHTDDLGQIKVHFHWDREGGRDEHSSCWIRTVQTWGGVGWGTQFIPRVGMEVLVSFEGGDPDKPIVSGCVYNATHPPSFALPKQKTRSGIKTSSTPGNRGSNELSFEDAAGGEQIYVHAQRDLDEVVERNHTVTVRGDEALDVVGNRVDEVEGNVREKVTGKKETHVLGDASDEVSGNRIALVSGNEDQRVSGDYALRLERREERDVAKNANHRYADDLTVKVSGCKTVVVGKHDAKRSLLLHAEGTATLSSTDVTEIVAEKELVLRCGKSMLRITPEKIEIVSGAFSGDGGGSTLSMDDNGMILAAKKEARVLSDKLVVVSEGASMSMGQEIKLDGKKILMNSPDKAEDPPPAEPAKTSKIELTDQDGRPLAHERYLLVLEDGTERSGVLDKDGKAEIQVEQSGKIYFPDMSKVEAG